MSMSGIKLRQWDSTPNNQEKFKIVTKFTDLGNPDSKKHVFGFYINISIEPQQNKLFTVNAFNTTEDDVNYSFIMWYRKTPLDNWKILGYINNTWKYKQHQTGLTLHNDLKETRFFEHVLTVKDIQLKIESNNTGVGYGINDFGLFYRVLRDSNVEKHDEE